MASVKDRDVTPCPLHPFTRQHQAQLSACQAPRKILVDPGGRRGEDALEEAGCAVKEVLEHCRNGGEHVRGCWVVDKVLGKE
jgi:hypothetical protein